MSISVEGLVGEEVVGDGKDEAAAWSGGVEAEAGQEVAGGSELGVRSLIEA